MKMICKNVIWNNFVLLFTGCQNSFKNLDKFILREILISLTGGHIISLTLAQFHV